MRYGQIYSQVVLAGARPTLPPDMPDDYQLLMQRWVLLGYAFVTSCHSTAWIVVGGWLWCGSGCC